MKLLTRSYFTPYISAHICAAQTEVNSSSTGSEFTKISVYGLYPSVGMLSSL